MEQIRLQFRGEFFSLFNPRVPRSKGDADGTDFDTITGTIVNTPRTAHLGLPLVW